MSVENGIVQTELNLLNRPGRQLLSLPAAVHLGEHKIFMGSDDIEGVGRSRAA